MDGLVKLALLLAFGVEIAFSATVYKYDTVNVSKNTWPNWFTEEIDDAPPTLVTYPDSKCSYRCSADPACAVFTTIGRKCYLGQPLPPPGSNSVLQSPAAEDRNIFVKDAFATERLGAHFASVTGVTARNWTRMVFASYELPTTNSEPMCAYTCLYINTCYMFVIDGNNCHLGSFDRFDNPASSMELHQTNWTVYYDKVFDRPRLTSMARATASHVRVVNHIFETLTTPADETACLVLCLTNYELPRPCELAAYNTGTCYIGNTFTNNTDNAYPKIGKSLVFIYPRSISELAGGLYTSEGILAPSTWTPWIYTSVNLSTLHSNLWVGTCLAACHYADWPCTLYAVEDGATPACWLGDRDVVSSNISSTANLEVFEKKGKFLAVFTGYMSSSLNSLELIPLDGNSNVPSCFSPMPAPVKVYYAGGGMLNSGKVILCGGTISGYHATSQCYTYTVEDNMWRTAGSMNYPRTRFGYDAHPDWGFVAATGEDNGGTRVSTVEYTEDGETFTNLPSMSLYRSMGCLAIIDHDRMMATGGSTSVTHSATMYLYKKSTGSWSSLGGNNNPGNYVEGCRVTHTNGVTEVVLAGRSNGGNHKTVWMYNPDTNVWRTGSDLPISTGTYSVQAVRLGTKMLINGGKDDMSTRIYRYDSTGSGWTRISPDLTVARYHHASAVIHGQHRIPQC